MIHRVIYRDRELISSIVDEDEQGDFHIQGETEGGIWDELWFLRYEFWGEDPTEEDNFGCQSEVLI